MEQVSENSRIYYLDVAKVVTALLVIFAHFYSGFHPYCVFLYSFHVPLFFFISGIFHRKTERIQWKKYILTLLVPTLLFAVLEGVVRLGGSLFFHSFQEDVVGYVKILILGVIKGKGIMGLWFLVALFWCKVLTDVMFSSKAPEVVALILGILGIITFTAHLSLPLLLSQALMGWPFYIAGYFARKRLYKLQPNWKYLFLFVLFATATFLLSRYNGKVSMMGIYFGENPLWIGIPSFYLTGLFGTMMILSFSLLPLPETKLVGKTAKSLITVVGAQGIFFYFVYKTIGFDRPLSLTIPLSLVIFCFCCLLNAMIRPLLNRIT